MLNWSITDYEETDSGKYLKSIIAEHIKNYILTEGQTEEVYDLASQQYNRFLNNPKNAWECVKLYLKHCPDIFSVLDIIGYKNPIEKFFHVVSIHNSREVADIFKSFNKDYLKYDRVINDNEICIFVSKATYPSHKKYEEHSQNTGREIWLEIEDRKIPVGFYSYSRNTNNPLENYLSCFRSLNIAKKIRISNSGYRKDIGFGFRSAWEANMARILNYLGLSWEYETKSFLLKDDQYNGYYFPDFILPNNDIIEVKGSWDIDSRQKVRLFSSQFPDFNLIFIDGDIFYDLEKKFKILINDWEDIDCRIRQETIQVVGINRGERANNVKNLSVGDMLFFKRDPLNEYDPNAILVTTSSNAEIGFVSKDWAYIYAHKIDLGIKYITTVREIKPKVMEVFIKRINVETEIIHDTFK